MVLDELKRVSAERDGFRSKLAEAERSAKEAWNEVAGLKGKTDSEKAQADSAQLRAHNLGNGSIQDSLGSSDTTSRSSTAHKSEDASSPISSSVPKVEQADVQPESEDFFSYDRELPRMEADLKERDTTIESLKRDISNLQGDLAVARESTESMVQTLENTMRELHTLRESNDRHCADLKNQGNQSDIEINRLKHELESAREQLRLSSDASHELKEQLKAAEDLLEKARPREDSLKASPDDAADSNATTVQADSQRVQSQDEMEWKVLKGKLDDLVSQRDHNAKRAEVLQAIVDTLKSRLTESEKHRENLSNERRISQDEVHDLSAANAALERKLHEAECKLLEGSDVQPSIDKSTPAEPDQATPGDSKSSKKKNKKKKKNAKVTDGVVGIPESSQAVEQSPARLSISEITVSRMQEQVDRLRIELEQKDNAIDRLQSKLKGEDDLREEIETLRDDLVNVGQEHVTAKDRIKELQAEKAVLEECVHKLENELSESRAATTLSSATSQKAHEDLLTEFEQLKTKATSLQTDLSAAQQLAASRFKELSEMREMLQKAQPELRSLRIENAELKGAKDELEKRRVEVKRLEARHEDVRSELKSLRVLMGEREAEIKVLNQKISQESTSRSKAEEDLRIAQSDLRHSESAKQEATEMNEKTSRDLARAQEEARNHRGRLLELEEQHGQLDRDANGLREEVHLKTAQYASAQSLMSSMRDQTSEMAMQMREARERCESLEEELGDAHRLLSERSREGETMRRLLADVEGRADSRIREMKDRMDVAIDERDRAEDEANTVGRKRAREAEELKAKLREAEKALGKAEEDREEVGRAQKEWKRKREELELTAEQATQELRNVRQAMDELRDTLDASEKQTRELEKQKADLRRSVEETQSKVERLQRSNKVMTDEMRTLQASKKRGLDSGVQSSRTSIESAPSRPNLASPAPSDRRASATPIGPGGASVDYVYLKNVLLQFLEQKDKNHQKQLIPVLSMLLHFDK